MIIPAVFVFSGTDGMSAGPSLMFVSLPNGSAAQLLDIMDYISNSVMMPLIALLSTILIGWVKAPEYVIGEMELGGYPFRRKRVYIVMIRYIAPIMMLILFLQSTGILG